MSGEYRGNCCEHCSLDTDAYSMGQRDGLLAAADDLEDRVDHSWDWSGTLVQDSIVDWLRVRARAIPTRFRDAD